MMGFPVGIHFGLFVISGESEGTRRREEDLRVERLLGLG